VVHDLVKEPMLPLRNDQYVTCLDLGPWGAVYTEGWDRHVTASGAEAKTIKRTINCDRIYPPRSQPGRNSRLGSSCGTSTARWASVTQAPSARVVHYSGDFNIDRARLVIINALKESARTPNSSGLSQAVTRTECLGNND
jgi:hypothetical protein